MKNPYLSIIIPMHNTAQYIQQCLDSIVVQNGFPNFQVIVIDDGSTDNGLSIVQEYSIKHNNIELACQRNLGVSAARNRGMEMACGEFISFIDADDMIGVKFKKIAPFIEKIIDDPKHGNMIYQKGQVKEGFPSQLLGDKNYFTRMIDAAKRNKAEIVMGGKVAIQNQTSTITALTYNQDRTFGTKTNDKNIIVLQSFDRESANFAIYRRDFLKHHKLQFEIDMPLDEDILFCSLAVLHANTISTVRDSIYLYNRRSGSLTDYANVMSSSKARHRYSAALVQNYGSFLMAVIKYPQYAPIYQKYMHEFGTMRHDAVSSHLKFFPVGCDFCSNNSCEGCVCNPDNIKRIKKGIKKLLPNRNQLQR